MAGTATVNWIDINNEIATNSATVDDFDGALLFASDLKAASNAKITSVVFSQAVDISELSANIAVQANNESARTKAAVTLSGPNPTVGLPRITAILQIPAPLGAIINGAATDKNNALLTALLNVVRGNRGETLDAVDRIDYAK